MRWNLVHSRRVLSLTFRAWLRYLVPLTLIAAATMIVFVITGLRVGLPGDLMQARAEMHLGWVLAATAWIFQLVLVGAAAPMVRSVAHDAPLAQTAALLAGIRGLARAALPVGLALGAVVLGSVALVVPGLLLLGLFALTGASEHLGEPLPAALVDSVAVVRANAKQVAIVLAITIAGALAIALAAHLAILPAMPKKLPVAQLAAARTFVRVIAFALVVLSALPACGLAVLYGAKRQTE
jgi:hypothetical protein